jgi:formate/nitrite transporter FocA (FNT family)
MKKHGKTVLFGIYAGMAIGFGGMLNIIANTLLSNAPFWGKLLGSVLFPIGLTMVCFFGFNLFTGKIGYVFDYDKSYLLFLLFVYIGNIIGALLMGVFCRVVFPESALLATANGIANAKLFALEFLPIIKVFAGSVLCGVLVYLAILSYKSFKQVYLKIIGIFLAIGLFVFLKFDHCIANMYYFAFAWTYGQGVTYLALAVVTLGNSLGAIALNEGIKAFKKLIKKNEEKNS